MSAARRIFLIRHGETPSNAAHIFQLPETPLSDRGVAQAHALATRLRAEPIARVIASDYERAAQTARAVADVVGAALELEPLLRERNFGDLRGTPYSEVPGDPFRDGYTPPGGESWHDFHLRVERAWVALAAAATQSAGDLAVVTHGLVCRALVERSLGASELLRDAVAGGLAFANTSVTIAEASPPWRVERIGCTQHLGTEHAGGAPA
jgi:probable phosphoglycerate mutase